MQVGILGGAFNPPHLGHVICAQEARIQLELDTVNLMPVASPPHRQLSDDPGSQIRLQLCQMVASEHSGLDVLDLEIVRGGLSYTFETLQILTQQQPNDQFTLIIGADQALTFGNWREPALIGELANIAVAVRADADRTAALEEVKRATGKEATLVDMPRIDISSSLIRERISEGYEVDHLVAAPVAQLIREQGMYA